MARPLGGKRLRRAIEARARAQAELERLDTLLEDAGTALARERAAAGGWRRAVAAVVGSPQSHALAVGLRARLTGGDAAGSSVRRAAADGAEDPEVAAEAERAAHLEAMVERRRHELALASWRLEAVRDPLRRQRVRAALRPLRRDPRLATVRAAAGTAAERVAAVTARPRRPIGTPTVDVFVVASALRLPVAALRISRGTEYPAARFVPLAAPPGAWPSERMRALRSRDADLLVAGRALRPLRRDWLRRAVERMESDALDAAAVMPPGTGHGPLQVDLRRGMPHVLHAPACAIYRGACFEGMQGASDYRSAGAWALDVLIGVLAGDRAVERIEVGVTAEPEYYSGGDLGLLRRRWGPFLRRRLLAGMLSSETGAPACERRLRLWLELPTAAEFEQAKTHFDVLPWGTGDPDLVLERDAAGGLRPRWVVEDLAAGESPRDAAPAPLARCRLVDAGPPAPLDELPAELARRIRRPAICLQIGPRDWAAAETSGDLYVAEMLARAIGHRGLSAAVEVGQGLGEDFASWFDVVVHVRGRGRRTVHPGQLSCIWVMSHPSEVTAEELAGFDVVLVASERSRTRFACMTAAPVKPFFQFTDPDVFHPTGEAGTGCDLIFVANWRSCYRRAAWAAIRAGYRPALYGAGWRFLSPEHLVCERVPHASLAALYSSAAIVLNDHWDDMREAGFVSNRVFDALACGAFVVSDEVPGMAALLNGGVVTFRGENDLRPTLEHWLQRPRERAARAQAGREAVLARHTADHRADELLRVIDEALVRRARPQLRGLSTGDGRIERLRRDSC